MTLEIVLRWLLFQLIYRRESCMSRLTELEPRFEHFFQYKFNFTWKISNYDQHHRKAQLNRLSLSGKHSFPNRFCFSWFVTLQVCVSGFLFLFPFFLRIVSKICSGYDAFVRTNEEMFLLTLTGIKRTFRNACATMFSLLRRPYDWVTELRYRARISQRTFCRIIGKVLRAR